MAVPSGSGMTFLLNSPLENEEDHSILMEDIIDPDEDEGHGRDEDDPRQFIPQALSSDREEVEPDLTPSTSQALEDGDVDMVHAKRERELTDKYLTGMRDLLVPIKHD